MVLGITLLFTLLHILYVGTNTYSGTAGRVAGMTDADVPLLMVSRRTRLGMWLLLLLPLSIALQLLVLACQHMDVVPDSCKPALLPPRAQVGFGFGASFVALFAQLGDEYALVDQLPAAQSPDLLLCAPTYYSAALSCVQAAGVGACRTAQTARGRGLLSRIGSTARPIGDSLTTLSVNPALPVGETPQAEVSSPRRRMWGPT